MKLTKLIRDAFVRAAMNDVPKSEDFEAQAHALVLEESIAKLPAKVQPLARDKDLKFCLRMEGYYFYGFHSFGSATVFSPRGDSYKPSNEMAAKLQELHAKRQADAAMREGLKDKLAAAAYSCTTRKALVALLPEFEKYLPAEAETCKTLPAVANLVADFTKAGWPVGAKKGATK